MLVVIRGTVGKDTDPLYRGEVEDPITKLLDISDIEETISRWLIMGRTVDSVTIA